MATTLKSAFGRDTVRRIAAMISAVHPPFDVAGFEADATHGLARKELLARGDHVAAALRRHLPQDVPDALAVLVRSMGPEIAEDGLEGQGMAPFVYLPYAAFVRAYASEHFEAGMAANDALTRRFTGEWSIRPFLERDPARTFARLAEWAADPSVHLRRLVSEGTRPRLPWATRVRALVEDPRPGLALLERLKDDPSGYVRRSVANHLNDVSKDHPALAVETARRWLEGASPGRRRLVRHALRSLVKAGHAGALALLGHGGAPRVDVLEARVEPGRVRIGEAATFRATLRSRAAEPQSLAVDLAVHFVKRDGAVRPKVFKGRVLELAPGERAEVAKRISLAVHTTRRPNPGPHAVELIVNGARFPGARFLVVNGTPRRPVAVRRGRGPVSRRPR